MGFFGMFKRKDDFDSLLKDPLTDPLSKPPEMPGMSPPSGFGSEQQSMGGGSDLPPFDMPGMPKQESGIEGYSNNNDSYTSASAVQTSGGFESTYPAQQRRPAYKGPESYEEMAASQAPTPRQNYNPQQAQQNNNLAMIDKRDFEILNSKLDTIRSQLDSLNQRIVGLERKQYDEEPPRPKRYNW